MIKALLLLQSLLASVVAQHHAINLPSQAPVPLALLLLPLLKTLSETDSEHTSNQYNEVLPGNAPSSNSLYNSKQN
jgi:hypothetical protein